MSLHVSSGPATVLASGSATTWFGHPLALDLELGTASLTVLLVFADDPDEPGPRVERDTRGHTLVLTATNFGECQGRGTAEPLVIGSIGDDVITLHFRVTRFGATADPTVHYTFHRAPRTVLGMPSET